MYLNSNADDSTDEAESWEEVGAGLIQQGAGQTQGVSFQKWSDFDWLESWLGIDNKLNCFRLTLREGSCERFA